jgi:hypothetical protein
VNGKTYTQPITVKQDPRVKTPALVMQQVYSLTKSMYTDAVDAEVAAQHVQGVHDQIARITPQATGAMADTLAAFDKRLDASLAAAGPPAPPTGGRGGGRGGRGGGGAGAPANPLTGVSEALGGLMNSLQAADVQPTTNQLTAITTALQSYRQTMAAWSTIKTVDLPALNLKLKAAGLPVITP